MCESYFRKVAQYSLLFFFFFTSTRNPDTTLQTLIWCSKGRLLFTIFIRTSCSLYKCNAFWGNCGCSTDSSLSSSSINIWWSWSWLDSHSFDKNSNNADMFNFSAASSNNLKCNQLKNLLRENEHTSDPYMNDKTEIHFQTEKVFFSNFYDKPIQGFKTL